MQNLNSAATQHCPECGQLLQTLWDYPNNEVWCLRCGNRFYRVLSQPESTDPETDYRLLILDGDPLRRDALTGRFATLGYHVTPVCHPRQALEAASFRHFDLALLSSDWSGADMSALIGKLRWQLGNVKFVVYLDIERDSVPPDLASHDVLCVRTNLTPYEDLEAALEQLVHGLFDAHETSLMSSGSPRQFASVS